METLETVLRRIVHELRTYNPAADEYKGEHIHKVWAREIEAALSRSRDVARVADGWKIVPIEPTMEMLDRGHHQIDFDRSKQNTRELAHESHLDENGQGTTIEQDMRDAWAAMLAAAPSPAAGQAPSCGKRILAAPAPAEPKGEQQSSFPERDASKTNAEQGLYRKFEVRRVDGSDAPGGKHHGCEYFMLDITHDRHAPAALRAYAASCAGTHPHLSADLVARYGKPEQRAATLSEERITSAADAESRMAGYGVDDEMGIPLSHWWTFDRDGLLKFAAILAEHNGGKHE